MLAGYKTYIFAVLIAVATGVKYLGYIDDTMYQTLLGIFGAGSIASLRAGVTNTGKKLILIPFVALALSVTTYAQTPLYLAWDYVDTELPNVTEFQTRLDNGAYIPVGIPTGTIEADTPTGNHTYKWQLPAIATSGNHVISVRACNAVECSWEPSVTFKLIGPPTNLRIKK